MEADQIRVDSEQLASFGYRQQLTRALGLWSNFSLGFTYLSPVVCVYTLFGFGLTSGNTKVIAIVIIALAALINLTGVKNLARLAIFGVVAEILGTIVFGIIFLAKEHHHGVGAIFHTAGTGSGGYLGAFLAA